MQTVREMFERFYVQGASYEANRYYVLSEELRRRGWVGVGVTWWHSMDDPRDTPLSFEDAIKYERVGKGNLAIWYEFQVRKEWSNDLNAAFREMLLPVWERFKDALIEITNVPAFKALLLATIEEAEVT